MSDHTDGRIPDLFDQLAIGITVHDPESGAIVAVNDRLVDLYGYEAERLREMDVEDYSVPGEEFTQAAAERRIRAAAAGETQTFEWHVERADGEQLWVRVTLTAATLDGDEFVVAEIRDISEQKERERRTRAIFDQTYQFTGLLEPDGTLVEANQTALDFGGLDASDVIGKRVWNAEWFIHNESTHRRVREAVERAATGEFVRMELPVQGVNGETIIDFSIRPVTDDNGEVKLLIPEGRDISELKARERELRESNDLLARTEGLADAGGFEVDVGTGDIELTAGARRIIESADEQLTVEDALGYISHHDRERVQAALGACIEHGEPYDIEVRLITESGRERWVRTRAERIETDDGPKVRGLLRDIAERKEREQRVMVMNRVLRHNLRNQLNVVNGCAKNVYESLAAASDDERPSSTAPSTRAQSSSRRGFDAVSKSKPAPSNRSDRTAREPHTGADASADADERGDSAADGVGQHRRSGFSAEAARTQLEHVIGSSEELISLADTIQQSEEVFKAERLQRPVAVGDLLEELQAVYAHTHPDASIEIRGEAAAVRGNRSVLRVALEELVDNAISHGDDQQPSVTLDVSRPTAKRVRITVADDGPGLPDAERQALLSGEETPLSHGSGLGLWLVSWATTRLDGTLGFSDDGSEGTTVTLTFPAAARPTDSPDPT